MLDRYYAPSATTDCSPVVSDKGLRKAERGGGGRGKGEREGGGVAAFQVRTYQILILKL